MVLEIARLSKSLRDPFDSDEAYLHRKSILQSLDNSNRSAKAVDEFEVARKIVHRWDEASIEVRQAYRQFAGAVVELIDGVVNDEEFKEAALAVYRLFGAPGEEEEVNRRIIEKKSELQKLLGHAVSHAKVQKVVNAVRTLSNLQPDNHEAMYTAETQVIGDDGQEFGANLVFHQPSRFLVDASFEDGDLWGESTNVTSTSLHREWYGYNERTNRHPVGGKFDLEWLGNECSRIVNSSASQLPQDELAMAICRVLDSEKAGDEIAADLLGLVGDGAFETVEDLLKHRKELVDAIHHGMLNLKPEKAVSSSQPRMPSYGTQVTVQTESEKQFDELRRKEEKKQKRGTDPGFDSDLSLTSFSSLLHASAKRSPFEDLIGLGEGSNTSTVTALPQGTTRKHHKGYEEVSIPSTETAPMKPGEKLEESQEESHLLNKLHRMLSHPCTNLLQGSDYLDIIAQLHKFPSKLKLTCLYKAYLTIKLETLVHFYERANPVQDIDLLFSQTTSSLNTNEQNQDSQVVASLEARISTLCQLLSQEEKDDTPSSPLLLTDNCGSPTFMLDSHIKDGLLAHQITGIKWLWNLHIEKVGAVIGDVMGSGKTRQMCAFLRGLFDSHLIERALIVCPKSMLKDWVEEFSFMGLPVNQYYGRKKDEELLQFKQKEKGSLLTSYGTVTHNENALALARIPFDYCVLDEGHLIKNPSSVIHKNIKSIRSEHRIILSGTPMQNKFEELWTLYSFCAPKLFGDIKSFKEDFKKPLQKGANKYATLTEKKFAEIAKKRLDGIMKPYFLRRTTSQVFTKEQLLEKFEFVVWLKLTGSQRALYESFVKSGVYNSARSLVPFVLVTILRQICGHPCLPSLTRTNRDKKKTTPSIVEDDHGRKEMGDKLHLKLAELRSHLENELDSCKISFIVFLVDILIRDNHNTLIFSEWPDLLRLIKTALKEKKHKCLLIDGKCSRRERDDTIKEFETGDVPVLLLTTGVGSVGLTLIKADRVILVNPAWNPSSDDQSVGRAYRYGQSKHVVVYRLITCGTAEENIYNTQVYKSTLIRTVTEAEPQFSYFTEKETKECLSIGNLDYSSTYKQLWKKHDRQWEPNALLKQHMAELKSFSSVYGINNHSLLFSKQATRRRDRSWYKKIVEEEENSEKSKNHLEILPMGTNPYPVHLSPQIRPVGPMTSPQYSMADITRATSQATSHSSSISTSIPTPGPYNHAPSVVPSSCTPPSISTSIPTPGPSVTVASTGDQRGGSADLSGEEKWRPIGRMRGSLSGHVSETLDQNIIRPNQPVQAARPQHKMHMTSQPPPYSLSASQGYSHGYGEPKYDNQGPGQHPPSAYQQGYAQQGRYGKPPAYSTPQQGPYPQPYGQPRPDVPYQGPNAPAQQPYPYASSGPNAPAQQAYTQYPANDGYSHSAPGPGGYPPQSGQPGPQPQMPPFIYSGMPSHPPEMQYHHPNLRVPPGSYDFIYPGVPPQPQMRYNGVPIFSQPQMPQTFITHPQMQQRFMYNPGMPPGPHGAQMQMSNLGMPVRQGFYPGPRPGVNGRMQVPPHDVHYGGHFRP